MDAVFVLVLALEAIPIGLVTFADRPSRGRGGSGLLGRGSLKGFNCCEACGVPLAVVADAPWRLNGACLRCGTTQAWATPDAGPSRPVEPWTPIERPDPSTRRSAPRTLPVRTPVRIPHRGAPAPGAPGQAPPTIPEAPGVPARRIAARGRPARAMPPQGAPSRGVPARGAPSRGVPARTTPVPPQRVRPERPPRDPGIVDPFVLEPAARASNGLGTSRVQRRTVHRPRPSRRGFRREDGVSHVSAVLGQKGFNCCEACGDPLPREPDREWRYAGTCPRCGRVQIWAT